MDRRRHPQHRHQSSAINLVVGASLFGAVIGVGSIVMTPQGRNAIANVADKTDVTDKASLAGIASFADDVRIGSGVVRQRSPQAGDNWGGCNDARAAGTAPIYRSEPGYRADMDGDHDGIACEPRYDQ